MSKRKHRLIYEGDIQMDISKVDKNLAVETNIDRPGLCFYDAEESPFRIYGVFKENGLFRRMTEEDARKVSPAILELHTCAAGGRVRFVTDSPYVALKTEYFANKMPHFALTGSCGFDLYSEYGCGVRYEGTYVPPYDVVDSYENVVDFDHVCKRVVTINFPPYSVVKKVYIGLQQGSILEAAPEYKLTKPVVYYGSSITQGGCASKPGSTYQSILSFRYDWDYINLGFSGSALGEDAMTDYIKGLDMGAFVLDYDYNAPTPEHLQATHSRMYEGIRAVHPDLPIIMMAQPKYYLNEDGQKRLEIIRATYLAAREKGDENVYFLSGQDLMELVGDNGLVDGCHPTDSGFFSMAKALEKVFDRIVEKM